MIIQKKKLVVTDILLLAGCGDKFIIRDVTPALHTPGPGGE